MACDLLFSLLDQTLILCILSFIVSLAPLPPLLTSPTVLFPGSRFQSLSTPRDLIFRSPSQRPCVEEPEATFPNYAEPRALRSLIGPFALPSSLLNFSRLPQTLLIHCHWPRQSCLSHAKASSSLWHEFSPTHF